MDSPAAKKVPIHLQSSQNRLLIKNGRIVNDDNIFDADIFIENGIISQIGKNLIVPGGIRTIDASATSPNEVNYILPGGIDTHTHLDAQFMGSKSVDDYYTGSRAAIAGGTTTICNFVLPTSRKPGSLVEAFEQEKKLAEANCCCDYTFHLAISDWIEGKTEQEIAKLVTEYGVNSFKIFLCYSMQLNDAQIIRVLECCAKYGAIVIAHCESGDIIEFNASKLIKAGVTGPEGHLLSRPECIETEATHRVSLLAEQVKCPLLVAHVMSKSAAKMIAQQRTKNSCLFGETLVASIGTDGTHYFNKCWQHAAAHVMSPPLRPDTNTRETLLNCLQSGSLQVLGSDHCVFNSNQKAAGESDFRKIPNGVNGIEERMLIAWEFGVRGGFLDPCKFVAITSSNAARLFNLYPRKGRIQVGSDADLVVWGRQGRVIQKATHQSKCDFNIFEGCRIDSGPLVVIAQGRVVLDQTGLHVVQGSGRFLARQPFPVAAYGPLRIKSRLMPLGVDRSSKEATVEAEAEPEAEVGSIKADINSKVAAISLKDDQKIALATDEARSSPHPSNSQDEDAFFSRTKNGVRNMQDSTFKLTGEQVDDKLNSRTNIRTSGQPPGGKSSGIW